MERYELWGLNGRRAILVYDKIYLDEEKSPDGTAGYFDCVRIEAPKHSEKK